MSEGWQSAEVNANGISIHYHRTGGDLPPLVLAHGFTDNGLCWNRVAKALEADFDVIMPDARGHGRTPLGESENDSTEPAADLAEFVRALDLRKPALMGHSMGAYTVAVVASRYPDLPSRIVLEDPPWWGETGSDEWVGDVDEWRDNLAAGQSAPTEAVIAAGKVEHPDWDEAEWLPWAQSKQQVDLALFDQFGQESPQWQEAVRDITCPVLLVTADPEQGAIITPSIAVEALALWPKGRHVHIAGAGHSIRREQFTAFMTAVRAFLCE